MILFEKEYSDESLVDLDRDLYESVLIEDSNLNIPMDDEGYFRRGVFKVIVEWRDE